MAWVVVVVLPLGVLLIIIGVHGKPSPPRVTGPLAGARKTKATPSGSFYQAIPPSWAPTRPADPPSRLESLEPRPAGPKTEPQAPEISITMITSFGEVAATSDGAWILNPKAPFRLTLEGVDKETAKRVKEALEGGYSKGFCQVVDNLVPVIARSNLRRREVDAYTDDGAPSTSSGLGN